MADELISIIVPIYNVEKYLRQCLDSIQNQTYQNFECLLINDGSPDHSSKIC
ncbi:TPA: glycosyltransferase family 2 protein, partial [Streptococcus pneumoniae]